MSGNKNSDIGYVASKKLYSKSMTKYELIKWLSKKGYDDAEIEQLVSEFETYGYINDYAYSISYFEYADHKLWSSNRAFLELSKKGVESEIAKYAFEEHRKHALSDAQKAYALMRKMIDASSADDESKISDKVKAKIARRLYSYGYSSNLIFKVLNDIDKSYI